MTEGNKPIISVIVPVHNSEPYLKKCIESILAQKYENLEVLLVLNGKIFDRSKEISYLMANNDKRIRVFETREAGVAVARNLGIQKARGDYIGFVDSDDWIEPNMYASMIELMVNYNAQISICNYQVINHAGKRKNARQWQSEIIESRNALERLCTNEIESFCWNKLFQASMLEGVVFPQTTIFEDVAVMPYIFSKANRIVLMEQALYNYVKRRGSLIDRMSLEDRLAALEVYEDRINFMAKIDMANDKLMAIPVYYSFISMTKASLKTGCMIRKKNSKRRKQIVEFYERTEIRHSYTLGKAEKVIMGLMWKCTFLTDCIALACEALRRAGFILFLKNTRKVGIRRWG